MFIHISIALCIALAGAAPTPEGSGRNTVPPSLNARAPGGNVQSQLSSACLDGARVAIIKALNTPSETQIDLSNSNFTNACINDVLNIAVTQMALEFDSSITMTGAGSQAFGAPTITNSKPTVAAFHNPDASAASSTSVDVDLAVDPQELAGTGTAGQTGTGAGLVNGCPAPPTRVLLFQPAQTTKRPSQTTSGGKTFDVPVEDDIEVEDPEDDADDEVIAHNQGDDVGSNEENNSSEIDMAARAATAKPPARRPNFDNPYFACMSKTYLKPEGI
ncbi:hypothetical protein FB45DRAFT_1059559 [Roridomyces roridus]|uniref:Uncharacterized protein n=1 Tax=Roridomyces roridus TaxID=1738132 RepID=A0AAD7BSU5_9AGAR|nr:hypothetical protein FB45DRAFT_1059559 [Roridomyces roridus]